MVDSQWRGGLRKDNFKYYPSVKMRVLRPNLFNFSVKMRVLRPNPFNLPVKVRFPRPNSSIKMRVLRQNLSVKNRVPRSNLFVKMRVLGPIPSIKTSFVFPIRPSFFFTICLSFAFKIHPSFVFTFCPSFVFTIHPSFVRRGGKGYPGLGVLLHENQRGGEGSKERGRRHANPCLRALFLKVKGEGRGVKRGGEEVQFHTTRDHQRQLKLGLFSRM